MAKKKDVEELEWEDAEPGPNTPYQAFIPVALHAEVIAKSKETGIKIAPFIREAFRMFRDTPADELFKKVQIAKKGE